MIFTLLVEKITTQLVFLALDYNPYRVIDLFYFKTRM